MEVMDAQNEGRNPESLATDVLDGHRELSRDRYQFLVRLREFDLHRAYKGHGRGSHGAADTAAWLQATCGIPHEQAREQLRVAYTLLNLPRIEAAFEAGDLSYAKVRALASVATMAEETSLLALARVMSDAQVQDHCLRLARECVGKVAAADRGEWRTPIYCTPVSSEGAGTHVSG